PAAPTGAATQTFCSAANPTIADLLATGTAIQWYAAATGGSPLAGTTALVNGSHYFASQTTTGCESVNRLDVTVVINTTPAAPTGAATKIFCSADNTTIADLVAIVTYIQYNAAATGGIY